MAKMQVPVTKAGKGATVEVDTDSLPTEVYAEALLQGLKVLLNRGMSKITKADIPDQTTRESEAMTKANANLEDLKAGKFRRVAGSTKKASGAIMTEAMRLARNIVKDALKAQGFKVSHYAASEITKAAKEYLEADPEIIEQAKANLEAQKAAPKPTIDLSKLATDPRKIAEAEARKAKAKTDEGQLSARQAGKVQARQKGKVPANA